MTSTLDALAEALYGDGEEENWLRIVNARWTGDDLHLDAALRTGAGMETVWQLHCHEVLEHSITDVAGGGLNHLTDPQHPVLRKYLDPQAKLYFRGTPADPALIVGDLWLVHRELCDDWVAFDRCVRREVQLDELLSGGYGQLAEGPRFVLDAYAEVLQKHDVGPSIIGDRPFQRWDGSKFVQVPHVEALHLGDSFVVASAFKATRQSTVAP